MDVPLEENEVVAVADTDVSFPFADIDGDQEEGMRCLEAKDFRGDDVEKPPGTRLVREIDDTVRQQHRPIDGVAMPGFCADERDEVFPKTGRQVFCGLHNLLHLALQGRRIPVGMSAQMRAAEQEETKAATRSGLRRYGAEGEGGLVAHAF